MQAHPSLAASADVVSRTPSAPSRLVTDAPTRMFHWLFALSFLGAYLTADGERWRMLHVTLGYTMAGLLAFRVLYGLLGPRQSGLGLLWRKLAGAPAWLASFRNARAISAINWRQGQNLVMALAVVALLAMVVPLTLTGYATFNDWGDVLGGDWLGELHEFFGEAILFVVLVHIALVAGQSLLRRKNQALPMLTGRVAGPGPDLVKKNRVWLAALLLIAVFAYGAWEWQQSPNGLIPTGAFSGASLDHQGRDDHDD
ncbi:cytochrome b/b6 domain-containing protein [Hydrogenophaga crassostreae]|uniref:cytochrome b/b6 domain-containing protein n=1 Tax=Hydrogenophaga crassostreae TaxID=1763535 RepID=UPI0009EF2607|nr:cytochrome b/b6 domain-containing protein [Hydrogenophaga crassostreae]